MIQQHPINPDGEEENGVAECRWQNLPECLTDEGKGEGGKKPGQEVHKGIAPSTRKSPYGVPDGNSTKGMPAPTPINCPKTEKLYSGRPHVIGEIGSRPGAQ